MSTDRFDDPCGERLISAIWELLGSLFPDYIAVVGTSFCLSCTCLPATSPCFNVLSLCCLSTCDIHTHLILKEYQRVSHSLIRWITASCLMWKNHLKKFCTEEQSKQTCSLWLLNFIFHQLSNLQNNCCCFLSCHVSCRAVMTEASLKIKLFV